MIIDFCFGKGWVTLPKQMSFRKSSKGEGSFSIKKKCVADFGPLNRAVNMDFSRKKIAT